MKENKGGFLTNEQVEADNQVKRKQHNPGGYTGVQDTGEQRPVRSAAPERKEDEEEEPGSGREQIG